MNDDVQDSSDAVPVEFDLDAWLDGAQLAQRSVVVYGRPDLIGRMDDVARRLEAAERAAEDDEGSLGESSEVAHLREQAETLVAELEASKSVWYVQGLAPEVGERLVREHPIPDAAAKPTPEQVAAREAAIVKHNLHWIATAVVKIEDSQGRVKHGVTYEQMVRLRSRLGDLQIARLKSAAQRATVEEPQVPAPFSRTGSGTDRT